MAQSNPALAGEVIRGPARVVDGDTLEVSIGCARSFEPMPRRFDVKSTYCLLVHGLS